MPDIDAKKIEELLPCPFCGAGASLRTSPGAADIHCDGCDSGGPYCGDAQSAIAAWNHRASLSLASASVEDGELLRVIDETLQTMASQASVPMDLWDKHSNAVLSLMAHIRSLSARVEGAERLVYTGAISLASIDEGAPRPETWKERAENRQAVFLLAKRRATAAESEAAALRKRVGVLEKALEPFAKTAEYYEPNEGDDADHLWGENNLKIGDLRRARTALEASNV